MLKKLLGTTALAVTIASTFISPANAVKTANLDGNIKSQSTAKNDGETKDEKTSSESNAEDNKNLPHPPTLRINGFTVFNVYGENQRDTFGKSHFPHASLDVSELFFTIDAMTPTGYTYGGKIVIEVRPGDFANVKRNYIQFGGPFGTFVLGGAPGPDETMIQGAARLIGGTGGFDGGMFNVYNLSAGVFKGAKMVGNTSNTAKLIWYSPNDVFVQGLKFGIALTPNTAHRSDNEKNNHNSSGHPKPPGNTKSVYPSSPQRPYGINNVSMAVSFSREFEQILFALSGAMIFDKSKFSNTAGTGDTKLDVTGAQSHQIAFMVGFKNVFDGLLQFAVDYINNRKSRMPRNSNFNIRGVNMPDDHLGNAGKAINAAIRYTKGIWKFSVGHQSTRRKTDGDFKATGRFTSFTIDVVPVQGLTFFTEVFFARTKTNDKIVAQHRAILNATQSRFKKAIGNNSGEGVICGTKIAF